MVPAKMDRVNPQVYRVFCVDTCHHPLRCEDKLALSSESRGLLCVTDDRAGGPFWVTALNRCRDNLYVFHAVLRKVAPTLARGVERSETTRANVGRRARTALSCWTEPIRREQPAITSAPTLLVSTCSGLVPWRNGRDQRPVGRPRL